MAWKRIKETLWGNPNKGISGEPDPNDLTLENAYKTRWIWYHTILGIELLIVIIVQVAILTLLAVKL
jgi:hypothetical protein|tara:strand:+ start:178 stop:378 length:201 start_codon:yes stop_codon:yes gene_type:complete